jgi:hypothetical protein
MLPTYSLARPAYCSEEYCQPCRPKVLIENLIGGVSNHPQDQSGGHPKKPKGRKEEAHDEARVNAMHGTNRPFRQQCVRSVSCRFLSWIKEPCLRSLDDQWYGNPLSS